MPPAIAILTGPTATGKSGLALEFASQARKRGQTIELINADSLIVYRELDVGTAKPTAAELASVPHHLVNIRNPDEPYTAGDFRRDVERTLQDIHARGARALIVGGTGFYLKALTHGMWDAPKSPPELRMRLEKLSTEEAWAQLIHQDTDAAQRIAPTDRYRVIRALEIIETTGLTPTELEKRHQQNPVAPYRLLVIDREPTELNRRIEIRTADMQDRGIVEETARVLKEYGAVRPLLSVGYAQTVDYLEGRKPAGRQMRSGYDGLMDEIELATRQLVKRQRTWFRGIEEAERFQLDAQAAELSKALHEVYAP